jgi:hypothetical protein
MTAPSEPHSTVQRFAINQVAQAIFKNFFYYLWDSQWLTKT